ncbi:MAG: DUF4266 domain-containing protein [Gammaproteobacteria bacterium]|nr:DUF4266 domain-containing protein [Gammaproteobacteria bacterium]
MNRLLITLSISIGLTASLSGCSLSNAIDEAFTMKNVEPWQRDILAQDDMQLDPDPMRTFADEHIYFSKEASTGGRGVGGGGCGCN